MTAPSSHPTVHTERERRDPTGARRSARAPTSFERRLVIGLGVASGLGACWSGARPTALVVSDLVLLFVFGASVAVLTARARRWTWIVMPGLAGIAGPEGLWAVVAIVAIAVAVAGALTPRRIAIGALVGALSVQVLLRLPDLGFHGASALLAAFAVAPACVSGFLLLPTRRRHQVERVAMWTGAYIGVVVLVAVVAGLIAQASAREGVDQARTGLRAVSDGETVEAAEDFDRAVSSLGTATTVLDGPWMLPARTVPVLGQHLELAGEAASQAKAVSEAAGEVARVADVQQLRYDDGDLDLSRVEATQAPLVAARNALVTAEEQLADLDSGWLVAPAANALADVRAEVGDARDDAEIAAMAVEQAPAMFGGSGPRRYLVLFTQPAESRGLGGFVGAYAELTALDGTVEVTRSGPVTDLIQAPGAEERTLSGPPEYLARYGRYLPAQYLQDLTLSPDLSAVATAAAELYPQAGGQPVDGVIVVDPAGLAALMSFTGPVQIDGLDRPLTSANAESFLTRDQYLEFPDDDTRQDFLEVAGRETFENLVDGSLPSPREVGEVLGPVVEGRHLGMVAFDPGPRSLLDRLGASGQIAPPSTSDSAFVTTQNKGNNKIDVFLQRSMRYEVTVDPSTGELDAVAEITFRNDAPAAGLPLSVIGSNDQGLPLGTNVVNVSFYTRQRMREASVDGEPVAMEFQRELGYAVYSRYLTLAPGQESVLRIDLTGSVPAGGVYRLEVPADPAVQPMQLDVELRLAAGWQLRRVEGFVAVGDDHARAQSTLVAPFAGSVETSRDGFS